MKKAFIKGLCLLVSLSTASVTATLRSGIWSTAADVLPSGAKFGRNLKRYQLSSYYDPEDTLQQAIASRSSEKLNREWLETNSGCNAYRAMFILEKAIEVYSGYLNTGCSEADRLWALEEFKRLHKKLHKKTSDYEATLPVEMQDQCTFSVSEYSPAAVSQLATAAMSPVEDERTAYADEGCVLLKWDMSSSAYSSFSREERAYFETDSYLCEVIREQDIKILWQNWLVCASKGSVLIAKIMLAYQIGRYDSPVKVACSDADRAWALFALRECMTKIERQNVCAYAK